LRNKEQASPPSNNKSGDSTAIQNQESKRAATPLVSSKFVSVRRIQSTRKAKTQIEYDSTPEKGDSQSEARNVSPLSSKTISFQSLRRVLEPTKTGARAKPLVRSPNLGSIAEESISRGQEASFLRASRSSANNRNPVSTSSSSSSVVCVEESKRAARRLLKCRSMSPSFAKEKLGLAGESSSRTEEISLSSVGEESKRRSLSPPAKSNNQKSVELTRGKESTAATRKVLEAPIELPSQIVEMTDNTDHENETTPPEAAENLAATRRQSTRLATQTVEDNSPSPGKRKHKSASPSPKRSSDRSDQEEEEVSPSKEAASKWLKINDQIEIMYNDEDDEDEVDVQLGVPVVVEESLLPSSGQSKPGDTVTITTVAKNPPVANSAIKQPRVVLTKLNADELSSPNRLVLRRKVLLQNQAVQATAAYDGLALGETAGAGLVTNLAAADTTEESDLNSSFNSVRIGSTISDVIDSASRSRVKTRVNKVVEDEEEEEEEEEAMVVQSGQEGAVLAVDDQVLAQDLQRTEEMSEERNEEQNEATVATPTQQCQEKEVVSETNQTQDFFSFVSRHLVRPQRSSTSGSQEPAAPASSNPIASILSYVFDSFQF
jgi:hypothetical protein